MQIPTKIQHGEKVIATVFDKINGIIDYLNASRIRKGPGILVDESPSGTVIKLADNRPATPLQVLPAGSGGASGIEAAVSGGTASITLTGGTGSVKMVGAGSVSISKNENGEIEIKGTTSGSGGAVGFPDYINPLVTSVAYGTTYPGTAYSDQNVWLVGCINALFDPNNYALSAHVEISISDGSVTNTILLSDVWLNVQSNSNELEIPVMLPIPAGHTFELNYLGSSPGLGLKIYPCL